MHQLAITQSVVDTVLRRTGAQPVTQEMVVRLRIGRLTGPDPALSRQRRRSTRAAVRWRSAHERLLVRSIPDINRYLKMRQM